MDWRWVFQWIPCAWVFPSLQPPQKGRGHGLAAPLLDGTEDDNVLYALGEIKMPLSKEQLQQLHYATRSHQTELMTVAAQFLAHYADVLPMNSPVSVEALECTLALMDLDTIEVLIPASSAVSVMSSNGDDTVRENLAKRSVIRLAVRLLRSPSNPVVVNALAILTTYAGSADKYKISVVRDGALNPLCELAFSEDNRIQKGSGGAILNLSHIDTHCEQLLICGVCESLHHFLISGDHHLQFYAAATISNLSVQVEDPSGLVNDEGLQSLVKLLRSSERLIQQSCIALRNLASQSAMQHRITDCEVLEPLYPLLRHHDPNIQTAALSLLHNLSILEENEAKVINMGYVPELTLVVRQWQIPEGQRHAAATLRNLATPEHISTLVTSGVVEVLVGVVTNAKTLLPVLHEVAAVLAVLSRDMEAQSRLLHQLPAVSNMMQLFAHFIRTRQDMKLVFYSLGVIGGISSNGTLRDVVVQNTDIVSQITHYITPDTPSDLIKVVLWTTDLLYAHPTINGGVKNEMLASVTHLKAHASDHDVIGACDDLLAPS
ncbi:uncharacterized protein LOC134822557 [Bolinopsis microptera]|uniref:uncharacterized protein LOC134822557 n=1 Tax=Bolinopsis microptera TaxID=2820187 RepID=UPI00307A1542